jgi:hypothetical protein
VQDFSPANTAHLKVRTTFDGIPPPLSMGQEEMTVTLDSGWSLPSNVLIGGENDNKVVLLLDKFILTFQYIRKLT